MIVLKVEQKRIARGLLLLLALPRFRGGHAPSGDIARQAISTFIDLQRVSDEVFVFSSLLFHRLLQLIHMLLRLCIAGMSHPQEW